MGLRHAQEFNWQRKGPEGIEYLLNRLDISIPWRIRFSNLSFLSSGILANVLFAGFGVGLVAQVKVLIWHLSARKIYDVIFISQAA